MKPNDESSWIPGPAPRVSLNIPPSHSSSEKLNQAPQLTQLRFQGGYNNKNNNEDHPTIREIVRAVTVEETITNNESSYTSTEEDTKTDTNSIPPKTTDNY